MEDLFSELNERRRAVEENIAKSFDTDLEKARSGVYADTAENRKLQRVGQQYGGKKAEEQGGEGKKGRAQEETKKKFSQRDVADNIKKTYAANGAASWDGTVDGKKVRIWQDEPGTKENGWGTYSWKMEVDGKTVKRNNSETFKTAGEATMHLARLLSSPEEEKGGAFEGYEDGKEEARKILKKMETTEDDADDSRTFRGEINGHKVEITETMFAPGDFACDIKVDGKDVQLRRNGFNVYASHAVDAVEEIRKLYPKDEEKPAAKQDKGGEKPTKTNEKKDNKKTYTDSQKEVDEVISNYEELSEEEMNNPRINRRAAAAMSSIIRRTGISEKEFHEVVHNHPGMLGFSYDDYAFNDAENKLYDIFNDMESNWSDDDFMNGDKQDKFAADVAKIVEEGKVDKKSWEKVTNCFLGLDLPWSDVEEYKKRAAKQKSAAKQSKGGEKPTKGEWKENGAKGGEQKVGAQSTQPMMNALSSFNSSYKDETKVAMRRTPKNNWEVFYDGHRLGVVDGAAVSESVAKEMDWISDDPREHSKRNAADKDKFEIKDNEEE